MDLLGYFDQPTIAAFTFTLGANSDAGIIAFQRFRQIAGYRITPEARKENDAPGATSALSAGLKSLNPGFWQAFWLLLLP
jgi:hypothetical protein